MDKAYQYVTLENTINTLQPCNITVFNGRGPCTDLGSLGPERTEFLNRNKTKFWPIATGNIGGWDRKQRLAPSGPMPPTLKRELNSPDIWPIKNGNIGGWKNTRFNRC
jgi:hypothetical protein